MQGAGSIYFATLQGYVINETELHVIGFARIEYCLHIEFISGETIFSYAKTKSQISFAVTVKLISAFVFATRLVQFLFYLYPKFQASSLLL